MLGGLVAKKEAFDKIAPQQQAVVKEVFQRRLTRMKEVIRAENQEALSVMQKQGVKLLTPGKAQIADYKAISLKAMQKEGSHKYSPAAKAEVDSWLNAFAEGKK
jgi:TRAP-type C4-dicarboxylate transport system substrate-binding protein